jgi:molecular chaperone GrpE (heat shock protein)
MSGGDTVEMEAQQLRERAARLREMAQTANPASIASQLLEVAEKLDGHASQLELLAKQNAT